ncbi:hypothetical protein BDV11DRAFT_188199 [Aspergillus similis]
MSLVGPFLGFSRQCELHPTLVTSTLRDGPWTIYVCLSGRWRAAVSAPSPPLLIFAAPACFFHVYGPGSGH